VFLFISSGLMIDSTSDNLEDSNDTADERLILGVVEGDDDDKRDNDDCDSSNTGQETDRTS
jgi:hypothetical protein